MTTTESTFAPWPSFSEEEAGIVSRVLLSNKVNYWTGNEGREFEREFATVAGCTHAIAVANGTLALDLALHACKVGEGDEVIVTPRSFLASASCIINAGATPVFADVEVRSQNITAETIAPIITQQTRGIICVHHAGWPCDMDPIMALAEQHGLFVVEDCAQAHGATYNGRPVGGLGHIGCFSFCQDKIMTTGGEGGMVTTNDEDLWRTMWAFKDHGKSWDAVYNRNHPLGFRWLHESFGTNFRLTEMQSAIGRYQLTRMKDWHALRAQHAASLIECFNCTEGLSTPKPGPEIEHGWYRLYTFVQTDRLAKNWNRLRLIEKISERGVPCFVGSCPEMYLERAFEGLPSRPKERLPTAQQLGETSLCFLVHPTLTDQNIDKAKNVISDVMRIATS